MDPITMGIMGLNLIDKYAQRNRQNKLDQVEAKWSGFSNYKPFESGAGTKSSLTDLVQAGAWQRALAQAKDAGNLTKEKPLQVDESQAAKSFFSNTNPTDNPNLYTILLQRAAAGI